MTVNKAKRLQSMQRIRELLVQGYSYNTIIADLGLNERTFYRYLKKLFAQDIANLEKTTNEQMMRQVAIHVERSNNIYQGLAVIVQDSSVDPEARLQAYNDMFKLSNSQIETYTTAPFAAANAKRRLSAMQKGVVSPEAAFKNSLIAIDYDYSRFRPSSLYERPTATTATTEQQQQQETVVEVTTPAEEEEEEEQRQQQEQEQQEDRTPRRPDWWVSPPRDRYEKSDYRP